MIGGWLGICTHSNTVARIRRLSSSAGVRPTRSDGDRGLKA